MCHNYARSMERYGGESATLRRRMIDCKQSFYDWSIDYVSGSPHPVNRRHMASLWGHMEGMPQPIMHLFHLPYSLPAGEKESGETTEEV